MPRKDPSDQVKDVTVYHSGTGNLWACISDGSQWIYCNFVIHVPPKINTRSVTNFPTPDGGVPITVSPSINGSDSLVRFRDDIVPQLRTTYRKISQPYSYRRQREMFHPSVVGV